MTNDEKIEKLEGMLEEACEVISNLTYECDGKYYPACGDRAHQDVKVFYDKKHSYFRQAN